MELGPTRSRGPRTIAASSAQYEIRLLHCQVRASISLRYHFGMLIRAMSGRLTLLASSTIITNSDVRLGPNVLPGIAEGDETMNTLTGPWHPSWLSLGPMFTNFHIARTSAGYDRLHVELFITSNQSCLTGFRTPTVQYPQQIATLKRSVHRTKIGHDKLVTMLELKLKHANDINKETRQMLLDKVRVDMFTVRVSVQGPPPEINWLSCPNHIVERCRCGRRMQCRLNKNGMCET